MFGKIKQLAARVQKIDENKMLQEILSEPTLDAQIIDLNQKQLYEQGLQADGSSTGSYSPVTKRFKQAFGDSFKTPGESEHITGNDTGLTYDSMNVKSLPEGIIINADDRNNFFGTYAKKGLGLTKDSLNEIRPEIKERLREKIKKAIAA